MAALTAPTGLWKRGGREEDGGDCEMRRTGPEMLVDVPCMLCTVTFRSEETGALTRNRMVKIFSAVVAMLSIREGLAAY
jgi:hypothetical protein